MFKVDSSRLCRQVWETIKLQSIGLFNLQFGMKGVKFKDKMLLAQAESGVVLNDEQQDFLADILEETDDYCDDEATNKCIFHGNLYPVGSLNDAHERVILYIFVLIMTYMMAYGNQLVLYLICLLAYYGNDEDNYVPPPIQKNDVELSVIEQIDEQYKDSVILLEYAVKDGHSKQEAYLSRDLYSAINDQHNPVSVCDSEETLILAEESRLKMLEKQTVVNTKPIDYSKLNKLYEIFVPQTQLSAEQLYWSSIPSPPVTVSKPKVFPKKLPSTSQVLRNLNKARDLLTKFDECIKRRTTLSPHEIGSWEQSDIKGAFKKDVIPFSKNLKETFKLFEKGFITEVKEMKDIFEQMEDEVDQCSVAKKSFEIEKKQLLINNDRLLEENIASDIMCTYLRSLNEVDNCGKCKSLDIVLLVLQESNKSLCELRKSFAKLEEYNIILDIAFQNHKEQMIINDPETKNKQFLVKTINNQSVEINDLKVAFWGADDEEVSEGGIPRVIVLGYDGLPLQPVAPPSPDFIPGPENPQTPPVPQDEDEREPMFIQAHDPDYVPEPIYPKYIPLEDDHEFPVEEQPLPPIDSPTTDSPGYVTESDPEEDPEGYEDDETEDGPVDYPMDGGDDGDDDDGDSSRDDARDEDEDEAG
ncbi:hypothetical protein Tco_0241490 [Tanacetum coccineum]